MTTRPTTYAKHGGRAATGVEEQLDIFSSAAPVPYKRRIRRPKGHEAGRIGMKSAIEHAEAEHPKWEKIAIEAVRKAVIARPPGDIFTMEVLRAVIADSIPEPTELRAWGSVTKACKKANIIDSTGGYAPAVTSNGSPKPLYRRGAGA